MFTLNTSHDFKYLDKIQNCITVTKHLQKWNMLSLSGDIDFQNCYVII